MDWATAGIVAPTHPEGPVRTVLIFLATLTVAGLMDFMHLRWTTAAQSGRVLSSAVWAVLVECAALLILFNVLDSYVGVIASVVGSALGSAGSAYLVRGRTSKNIQF